MENSQTAVSPAAVTVDDSECSCGNGNNRAKLCSAHHHALWKDLTPEEKTHFVSHDVTQLKGGHFAFVFYQHFHKSVMETLLLSTRVGRQSKGVTPRMKYRYITILSQSQSGDNAEPRASGESTTNVWPGLFGRAVELQSSTGIFHLLCSVPLLFFVL